MKDINTVTDTDRMTDAEFQAWVHRVTSKDKRSVEEIDKEIENEAGI